tara:strand:+ start:8709 stop:9620 length:912 start_codon:yes stop_codon:yes gene_type:complete
MDPITLALATFGVQKLRGKSTKRSFRDALIVGGIGQLGGMAGVKGMSAYGQTALPWTVGGGGGNFLAGAGQGGALWKSQFAGSLPGRAIGSKAIMDEDGKEVLKPATGIMGWSPGMKIGAGLGLATLLEGDEKMPDPPFTEQDYKDAYNEQSKLTSGLSDRFDYGSTPNPHYYGGAGLGNIYNYNKGGLASIRIQKFATGGVSYLPSKIDHDEKDTNNYVRAGGQIADGAGAGDKNKDTILAQLADGEFVSRSDAILGAGIIEGAAPNSEEEMRKKGAAFFYSQQAKFKRVFDLLNASKKTTH